MPRKKGEHAAKTEGQQTLEAQKEGPATKEASPTQAPTRSQAPPTPPKPDPLAELKKQNEELQKEMLYLRADIDNTRKCLTKEADQRVAAAREQVVKRFLEVLDNFDRAIAVPPKGEDAKDFVNGVFMIRAQMQQIMEAQGIRPIPAEGVVFDPSLHEAIETVSLDDRDDHTIVAEVVKGYTINGRVLRPAKVKVNIKKKEEAKVAEADGKEGPGTCGCNKI